MPDENASWKQRYEFALEAIERNAKDHRDFTQELVRALNRLSLAAEGQDPELDHELRDLRAFLRLKTLSRDVLASKLDVLEEQLRTVARREHGIDKRIETAINSLLDQVEAARPGRETVRAAQLLRREIRTIDPLDVLARAVALQAGIKPSRETAHDAHPPGLLDRLFRQRGTTPAPSAPSTPSAENSAVPQSVVSEVDEAAVEASLGEAAIKSLRELIEALAPQKSNPRLHAAYVSATERISGEVTLAKMGWVLDDVLLLSRGALQQSRQEFSDFLEQLSSRLVTAAEGIAEGGELDAERRNNSEALNDAMRAGIDHIHREISGSRDLQVLKQEVNTRLQGIGEAFQSFRQQEERIGTQAASGARALAERVIELQQKTRSAELVIEEQRRLANTDTLTQLPNREAWSARLQQEHERWQRYKRPLTMAICDIDRFKNVNDRFGHTVGDSVLRAVSNCLVHTLRKTDFVARFGGEEFVFLLPETTPEQAAAALEKVRLAIAALSVDTGTRKGITVTASFGVATFTEEDEPDRVFSRADAALYQAKDAGRDRVVVYSAAPGT
jgi:diguanylate cyclase